MFGFKKNKKTPAGPPALTSQELQMQELSMRVLGLEMAIMELCQGIRYHLDRIDSNTNLLDQNMKKIAALTLRPPRDLLNGNNEAN